MLKDAKLDTMYNFLSTLTNHSVKYYQKRFYKLVANYAKDIEDFDKAYDLAVESFRHYYILKMIQSVDIRYKQIINFSYINQLKHQNEVSKEEVENIFLDHLKDHIKDGTWDEHLDILSHSITNVLNSKSNEVN